MFLSTFSEFLKSNEKVIKAIVIATIIILLLILIIVALKKENKQVTRTQKTRKMVATSLFAALSVVLYFLKFNLPTIFPFFLEIQFSNLPAFIGGFLLGPLNGLIIVIIRTIIKLPASSTICVGELADLLIGSTTVLVASLVYWRMREKNNRAILKTLVLATITWVIMAIVANALIIAPIYIALMDGGVEAFVGALSSTIPNINSSNYMLYYLTFAVLPFNLVLATLVSIVTFFVYKRIYRLYTNMDNTNDISS